MRLNYVCNFEKSFRLLKAYEVVLIYFAASAFWHFIFSAFFGLLPNMTYLQYPATAATTLQLTKYLDLRELFPLENFFGLSVSRSAFMEIFFVSMVSIAIGIGAWSLLVFWDAKIISPSWSYRFWNLIDTDTFRSIEWSKAWLVVDLICVVLVAPISEEIIFRGIIFRSFLKKYSLKSAILASSSIFAIFHCNHSFLSAFFHSILFSFLLIRLSSVYASIIAHGIYNLSVEIIRLTLGVSLVAESSKIDSLAYWRVELYFLLAGLTLGAIYIYFVLRGARRN